ncbi:helix-turn-helix transcriptional regulator [Halalkalibacterium halodurans]|uniref:Transcriptional repressor of PBSX genes n=3 Tax=Halalkalibacterium halodurans TaxID=86665 RepID=Q9KDC5_HALH5|nr:helix-turn-helix transcriptional regulator [Halalkalibacterium halodurans]BAB05007.1 transcriptional repressor of PBSX genes [Halalkalibacterium halodurans C-125]MDY7221815.1 helix-turn-helix transcriptional regulator [Halalkalibacterium halodurans]MDY7241091.1 helix-turn-helix transcriptional regulator [Halalkalibacterium halodurans]MED3647843.1 helix-turn-helix transcriptional regulator [Halalkalibacterium halodurans]MED4080527.1 helix-turn-helix transcriptional regulator [Halalkalibacter
MSFGKRLRSLRINKKLSQEELAKTLGLNRSTLARYELENTQPDYETLTKMADFFQVTTDYILGRVDDETTQLSISFSHGGEELTEDEKAHLEQELKKYRELKERFFHEKLRE